MKVIIDKYLEGKATEEEQYELLNWLRNRKNRFQFRSSISEWSSGLNKEWFPDHGKETWDRIQSRIIQRSYTGWQRSKKIQNLMRYAAICFFVISVGSLAYIFINRVDSAGELYTNIAAESGHISNIELQDGSIVWLNSGSTISYNSNFGKRNRDIRLEGEAFFQVSSKEKLPFIVACSELRVKVTGTEFNVTAYPETERISVVLEKGVVELLYEGIHNFHYRLKPGQRASFDKQNLKLQITNVNTKRYTSWKDGIVNIYDQTLEEVVAKLQRRYNQEFIVDEKVKDYRYTFSIRNESLEDILQLMARITPVRATQTGDTIKFEKDVSKAGRK